MADFAGLDVSCVSVLLKLRDSNCYPEWRKRNMFDWMTEPLKRPEGFKGHVFDVVIFLAERPIDLMGVTVFAALLYHVF